MPDSKPKKPPEPPEAVEEVDESSDESFPASDPPSWAMGKRAQPQPAAPDRTDKVEPQTQEGPKHAGGPKR